MGIMMIWVVAWPVLPLDRFVSSLYKILVCSLNKIIFKLYCLDDFE